MKNKIYILVLASLSILLAGCDPTLNLRGRQVRFAVSTKGDPQTKTSYSGVVTSGKERIDWQAGDEIRIYSSDKSKVYAASGGTITDNFVYTVGSVSSDGHASNASLSIVPAGQGLVWSEDPSGVRFYGTYPSSVSGAYASTGGPLIAFGDMTIPATQAVAWSDRVGKPDMSYAYMLSASDALTNLGNEPVHLNFYPLFNAFYIELKSQENTIELNSLTLSSTTSNLSGDYFYSISGLSDSGPTVQGVTHQGTATRQVTLDFPDGTTISPNDSIAFTLLTLPPNASQSSLTDMTLTVNFGENKTISLKLNKNGAPIQFGAFRKARITGVLMPDNQWRLTVDADVLPWAGEEVSTVFSDQIGIRDVSVSGMTETGNHYMANDVPVTDPSYFSKYYQVRTLDMSVTDPHFVVKFTPFAPFGGYWTLIPEGIGEGSLQHFDIKVYLGEGAYSTDLLGQIMSSEVEVHIFPKDFDPYAGISYAMIMKFYVSSHQSFDTPYNADFEFQDVHVDGRYSFWRFTLPSSH